MCVCVCVCAGACFCISLVSGEEDEDVEVKQTYVSQYESMHITAILQPYKFSEVHTDSGKTALLCIDTYTYQPRDSLIGLVVNFGIGLESGRSGV